ncbi:hypothetical protein ENBRE01_0885 [Enteropsectra breve]|nr:hypothetical protein ENBRE01_0885 [Enteropsectra breve]
MENKPEKTIIQTLWSVSFCIIVCGILLVALYHITRAIWKSNTDKSSKFGFFVLSNENMGAYLSNSNYPINDYSNGLKVVLKLNGNKKNVGKLSLNEMYYLVSLQDYLLGYHRGFSYRLYHVFNKLLKENGGETPFTKMAVMCEKKHYCPKTAESKLIAETMPIASISLKPASIDTNSVININEVSSLHKQLCTQCNSYFHKEEVTTSLSQCNEYFIIEVIAKDIKSGRKMEFKHSYSILTEKEGHKYESEYNVVSILYTTTNMFNRSSYTYTINQNQPLVFKTTNSSDVFYLMMKR